jgi:hypothetical protein
MVMKLNMGHLTHIGGGEMHARALFALYETGYMNKLNVNWKIILI